MTLVDNNKSTNVPGGILSIALHVHSRSLPSYIGNLQAYFCACSTRVRCSAGVGLAGCTQST